MSKSNYLENGIQSHLFGGASLTQPTRWFVAIHQNDPGENGVGTSELGVRKEITSWTISGASVQNDNEIQFDQAPSGGWNPTHFSLWDSETGGNCLHAGALNSSPSLSENDRLAVDINGITITEE